MNIKIRRETLEKAIFKQLTNLMDTEFVFHPIVHVHTGHLFGVEARFTSCPGPGFETRTTLFDTIREKGLLHQADLLLRQKILARFLPFRKENRCRIFLQLDHRICRSPDYMILYRDLYRDFRENGKTQQIMSFMITFFSGD